MISYLRTHKPCSIKECSIEIDINIFNSTTARENLNIAWLNLCKAMNYTNFYEKMNHTSMTKWESNKSFLSIPPKAPQNSKFITICRENFFHFALISAKMDSIVIDSAHHEQQLRIVTTTHTSKVVHMKQLKRIKRIRSRSHPKWPWARPPAAGPARRGWARGTTTTTGRPRRHRSSARERPRRRSRSAEP